MHFLILIFCVAALFAMGVVGLVKACTPKRRVPIDNDYHIVSCPTCGTRHYRHYNQQ